jgi:hypothetical protein
MHSELQGGDLFRLPDGQRVIIETIHEDGYVTVRRIEGKWKGQIAICAFSRLQNDHTTLRCENYTLEKD